MRLLGLEVLQYEQIEEAVKVLVGVLTKSSNGWDARSSRAGDVLTQNEMDGVGTRRQVWRGPRALLPSPQV